MASSWQPPASARVSDYYRPHAPLNLGRPPRPGPRQPDCWRPGQKTSPPLVKTRQQEQKQSKYSQSSNLSKPKQKESKTSGNSSKQFKGKDNGNNSRSMTRKSNPQRSGSNTIPLGRRQMGVINSIIRSEEQSAELTKVNKNSGDQSRAPTMAEMATDETPQMVPEETDSGKTNDVSAADSVEPETPAVKLPTFEPDEPFRSLLSKSHEQEWSRTKISGIRLEPKEYTTFTSVLITPNEQVPYPTNPFKEEPLSCLSTPTPKLRQKLDFGNRIDQCLLKMDKWADAWLSNALMTEDSNPDPDNAWQSFEYCLSMPDILEDGEIIEYEEVPRCELPATKTRFGSEGLKRGRRAGEWSSETLVEDGGEESGGVDGEETDDALTLPPIRLGKRSRDSAFLDSSIEDTSRTDFRETTVPEFRSSSPDYKRAKISHIPSAAALREEARKKKMLLSAEQDTTDCGRQD